MTQAMRRWECLRCGWTSDIKKVWCYNCGSSNIVDTFYTSSGIKENKSFSKRTIACPHCGESIEV